MRYLSDFNRKTCFYLLLSLLLAITFCIQWNLSFPGLINPSDTPDNLLLSTDNWYPVIISYQLKILYTLFSPHTYFYLLLNLLPLYIGVFVLAHGFYSRFHSFYALTLISILWIGNYFLESTVLLSTSMSASYLFLLYALILYSLLVRSTSKILWILIALLYIVCLLVRYNTIFQIFPISIYGAYILSRKFKQPKYVCAVLAPLFIVGSVILPALVSSLGKAHPSLIIRGHELAALTVPSNDPSCILDSSYKAEKSWMDVVQIYQKDPLFADPFFFVFEAIPLSDCFRCFIKHPINFLTHTTRLIATSWTSESYGKIKGYSFKEWLPNLPDKEKKLATRLFQTFSSTELERPPRPLALFLNEQLPRIHSIHIVGFCFLLFIYSAYLFFLKKETNPFILLLLCMSFGSVCAAFGYTAISPNPNEYRYVHPLLSSAVIGWLALLSYTLDKKKS